MKRSSDRAIVFVILVLSITYTNELYGEILDVNVVSEELPLDTFKDMYDSNLPLLSHRLNYVNAFGNQEDPEVKKLSSRTRIVNSTEDCVNRLRATKRVMCVSTSWEAERFLRKFGNMKIAKPVFSCDRVAYVLADGSPYAPRFGVLLQRIVEAGIWRPVDSRRDDFFDNSTEEIEDSLQATSENFTYQLLAILGICYSICLMVFCAEMCLDLQRLGEILGKMFDYLVNIVCVF